MTKTCAFETRAVPQASSRTSLSVGLPLIGTRIRVARYMHRLPGRHLAASVYHRSWRTLPDALSTVCHPPNLNETLARQARLEPAWAPACTRWAGRVAIAGRR